MKNDLACVLQNVPKEVINNIIQEQMKKSVLRAFEDSKVLNKIEVAIELAILHELKKTLTPHVKAYIKKNGNRLINEEVEQILDNDGLPDEVHEKVYYEIIKQFKNKFKTAKEKK